MSTPRDPLPTGTARPHDDPAAHPLPWLQWDGVSVQDAEQWLGASFIAVHRTPMNGPLDLSYRCRPGHPDTRFAEARDFLIRRDNGTIERYPAPTFVSLFQRVGAPGTATAVTSLLTQRLDEALRALVPDPQDLATLRQLADHGDPEPLWAGLCAAIPESRREHHRHLASALGQWWRPCPSCGCGFGRHEWRDIAGKLSTVQGHTPGSRQAICPRCTRDGKGDR